MKIKAFTYLNKATKLEIEKIEFEEINLLVGISGAGKTQILSKLYQLIELITTDSSLESIGSIKAEVVFEVGGKSFTWKIETDKNKEHEIVNEQLDIGGEEYFTRNSEGIRLEGHTLPAISAQLSLLKAYGSYKDIELLSEGMNYIIFPDLEQIMKMSLSEQSAKISSINTPDAYVYPSNMLINNLYRAYVIDPECFQQIKESFISIFPQIKDIKFNYEEEEIEYKSILISSGKYKVKRYILCIQESNEVWVRQEEISSGMIKTLFHLTYLKTINKQSVVLIDEFENGLGANCMEEITNSIICADNIQFILTSHHPYIINNIDMNYWKVVFRKGNKICTRTAKEMGLGHSKHEGFFQLMNKLQYEGEI